MSLTDEELRAALGHKSRKETRNAVKEFEVLRNNLAHTQEIIPSGWKRIVMACSNWEESLRKVAEGYYLEKGRKKQ